MGINSPAEQRRHAELGEMLGAFRPSRSRIATWYVVSFLIGAFSVLIYAFTGWVLIQFDRNDRELLWTLFGIASVMAAICAGGIWYSRRKSSSAILVFSNGLIFRRWEKETILLISEVESFVELAIHQSLPVKGGALMPRITAKRYVINFEDQKGCRNIDQDEVEDLEQFRLALRRLAENNQCEWKDTEINT